VTVVILKSKIGSLVLPLLLITAVLLLLSSSSSMHIIINILYNNYIYNKGLLEECSTEENVRVIRAATTIYSLKRRL